MSNESNANPSWDLSMATEAIRDLAIEKFGRPISDDTILRCLLVLQNSIDISLAICSELGLPVEAQAASTDEAHYLSHDMIIQIFSEIGKQTSRAEALASADG